MTLSLDFAAPARKKRAGGNRRDHDRLNAQFQDNLAEMLVAVHHLPEFGPHLRTLEQERVDRLLVTLMTGNSFALTRAFNTELRAIVDLEETALLYRGRESLRIRHEDDDGECRHRRPVEHHLPAPHPSNPGLAA